MISRIASAQSPPAARGARCSWNTRRSLGFTFSMLEGTSGHSTPPPPNFLRNLFLLSERAVSQETGDNHSSAFGVDTATNGTDISAPVSRGTTSEEPDLEIVGEEGNRKRTPHPEMTSPPRSDAVVAEPDAVPSG